MKKILKIGAATVNQTPVAWQTNTEHIIQAIQMAQDQGVDLLCLPELCITGYGCEDLFLTNWLSEYAWHQLLSILPHVNSLMVCVGLPIRINHYTYNGMAVLHQGVICGITLKQNLACDGVYYEPRWFLPWPHSVVKKIIVEGTEVSVGDVVYTCKGITLGFEICEDSWVKDRPAPRLCQRGVELILNPSASHFALGKYIDVEQRIKKSSQLYSCAYVYTNLLGNEAGTILYDGSMLIGYKGEIVRRSERLSFDSVGTCFCDMDFNAPTPTSDSPKKIVTHANEEFTQAVSLALFDYLRKSQSRGFVLSLSGGADSSCCAVMVAEMVKRAVSRWGKEKVMKMLGVVPAGSSTITNVLLTCIYQRTKNSSDETFHAAKELANSMGSTFYVWSVDEEVASYTAKVEKVLGESMTWSTQAIALENIQSRCRVPAVWMLANVKRCILLTTSNRNEASVGYATMDGDMSGSLAPIAGIAKPFIMQWLKWAENVLLYTGLNRVNALRPTAELQPIEAKQTDEADLMPYPLLEAIERLAIANGQSPKQIYTALSGRFEKTVLKDGIIKFFTLWATNQWKRCRMAPSFHLDDYNIDPQSGYRFPVLSGNFYSELNLAD